MVTTLEPDAIGAHHITNDAILVHPVVQFPGASTSDAVVIQVELLYLFHCVQEPIAQTSQLIPAEIQDPPQSDLLEEIFW